MIVCPKCGKIIQGSKCSCGFDAHNEFAQQRETSNNTARGFEHRDPFELGLEYYRHGTLNGYGEARELFLIAADSGNADAMCFLGEIYERGLGCGRDLSEALYWYNRAENAGRRDVHQRRLEIARMLSGNGQQVRQKDKNVIAIAISAVVVVLVVVIARVIAGGGGSAPVNVPGSEIKPTPSVISTPEPLPTPIATPEPLPTPIATPEPLQRMDLSIGDYVYFGTYGGENIRWKTLDVSGNSAMLIAANCIDCRPFNNVDTDVTWETCSLRTWLNGSFYNTAFSDSERSRILQTYVTNPNPPADYDAYGGNATYDYVFVLSYDECRSFFSDDSSRRTKGTEYALSRGANGDEDGVSWWLRTPGYSQSDFMGISKKGYLWSDGYDVNFFEMGVRPVIWIDMG